MTAKKKTFIVPQSQTLAGMTHFLKSDNELTQYMQFRKDNREEDNLLADIELPFDKALKGSITFQRDPSVKNGKYIRQIIRVYKKKKIQSTAKILESRYSRVTVSRSRITVSLSFPLCEDAQRLKARMQNFANIIVDESDEIAAMLNQEGDTKVLEAWQSIENNNQEEIEESC